MSELSRRGLLSFTVAASAAACLPTMPDRSRTTTAGPSTSTSPGPDSRPARPDGDVVRELGVIDGEVLVVAWQRRQGNARLGVAPGGLVLETSTHGRRLLTGDTVDAGDTRRLIARVFGPSTVSEARATLRALSRRG